MIKAVPWIIGVIGLVFVGLATVYWLTPADVLPKFLPRFQVASDRVHITHALGSLLVAIGLFAIAIIWFQLSSEDY